MHLVMNHFIILYNVFGDATTPLLFYKLDKDLWSILKTFVMYLERLPEFPITKLHDIPVDEKVFTTFKRSMTNSNLQKIIDIVHKLQEEMVANNVSGGQIAGTKEAGDDPPVRKKKPP